MAAPSDGEEIVPRHHVKLDWCFTRPKYRDGRKPKAIKVYTVCQESLYLMVHGVPAVGAMQDLVRLFALYGEIDEYRILDEYPDTEQFTETYWFKFKKIQAARTAKRKLDDFSFCGGTLHVHYAPEYESVADTRFKLQERRKVVARRVRDLEKEGVLEPSSSSSSSSWTASQQLKHSSTSGPSVAINIDIGDCTHTPTSQLVHEAPSTGLQSRLSCAIRENVEHILPPQHGQFLVDPSQNASPQSPIVMDSQSNQHMMTRVNCVQSCQYEMPYSVPTGKLERNSEEYFGSSLPGFARPGTQNEKELTECPEKLLTSSKSCSKSNSPFKLNTQKSRDNTETTVRTEMNPNIEQNPLLVVRNYSAPKQCVARFVPRQTQVMPKNVPHKSASSSSKDAKLNSEIKKNACVLGAVQGPWIDEEGKREIMKDSLTGDVSLEDTTRTIRRKIKSITSIGTGPAKMAKRNA